MNSNELMTLGLGLTPPWGVSSSSFEHSSEPGTLELEISAGRGATYPCPVCGRLCKAHDFKPSRWQHLNFFQHKCIISANVPRVKCPVHGVHKINEPWARANSGFTLLCEQAILLLCREMPVVKVAEITGINDTRIWRIITHYVSKSLEKIDLSNVYGLGVDETACKRGHNYVTVFVDMDRDTRPVIFATPGKGKETFTEFVKHLAKHGGTHENIIEVVCDMSSAFLSAVEDEFPYAAVTVDWFHVVQIFNKAVDEVRKIEAKAVKLPPSSRWAVLKATETAKTEEQQQALKQLKKEGRETSLAFLIKEKLRWIRGADTKQDARWRIKQFVRTARRVIAKGKYLEPMRKALKTFEYHMEEIVSRWDSLLTNARLESLNSLFQAVRARARGYRNVSTFITMIYLIAAPIDKLLCQK